MITSSHGRRQAMKAVSGTPAPAGPLPGTRPFGGPPRSRSLPAQGEPGARLVGHRLGGLVARLPDALRAEQERLSRLDLSDVRVFRSSPEPARLQALAFARGNQIHLAPGQERHLAHESWHVVQQRQGRVKPTLRHATGVPVNDDAGLEHEAEAMGDRARQRAGVAQVAAAGDPARTAAGLGPARAPAGGMAAAPVCQLVSYNFRWARQRRTAAGRRNTRTSQRARYRASNRIAIAREFLEDASLRGTYGQQRLQGAKEINKGRSLPLPVEVDHLVTDAAQRGGLARGGVKNRVATLRRVAAALPKRIHRLHPTTSGGRNYDRGAMANVQSKLIHGYPHVGTDEEARQRGHATALSLHLGGYAETRGQWPDYGSRVLEGAQENVKTAISQAARQELIDPMHVEELNKQAEKIFTKR